MTTIDALHACVLDTDILNDEERLAPLLSSLRAAIAGTRHDAMRAFFDANERADVASLLDRLEPGEALVAMEALPLRERAELFGYLSVDHQVEIAEAMGRQALAALMSEMSADERADLYKGLDPLVQEAVLPGLAKAEREDLRKLASYEEGTAGALMTSDYATLAPDLTATRAIEALRGQAIDAETVYQAYIVDEERRLVGMVSLRDLIVASPRARVRDLMDADPVFVTADTSREEVVQTIARYDLMALPVINGGDKLVGIVTQDDAMDVQEEEATSAFQKVASVQTLREGLRNAGVLTLYRARIVWLILLVFGSILSGAGIAMFEDTIAAHVALVFFLPVLIGSGGNAGSQAATLTVRAIAVGDVHVRDFGAMLGRELAIALLLGVTMALAISGIGLYRGGIELALVVALAMVSIVVIGSLIGMSLPFALSRLRFDPATASAPLVTSIADVVGVLIYFAIATSLLTMPA